MDQSSTTTPQKRSRNRPPRKEGPRMLQEGITDIVVTPNAKRGHHKPKHHNKNSHEKQIMSPPPLPEQIIPSIEGLDLSSDLSTSASTQQKKRNHHKKKLVEAYQPEQTNFYPQSPPAVQQYLVQGTPIKAMQMYAGPTFHASPAPSSLPMPKFFSQAVQTDRNSTQILSTTDDDSSGESSSQTGGDSPTLRSSMKALPNGYTREASPLDIFFNADRHEKAQKARLGSNLGPERAKSASPGIDAFRAPLPQFTKSQTSVAIAEDNQAKTQALKLLLFPPVQQTTSATASPFLEISQRPGAMRSTSETSTPTRSSLNPTGSPFDKRPFYDSPNPSTPPSSARPDNSLNDIKRPLPQHLRQAILNSLPLDQSPNISSKSDIYMVLPRT